MAKRKPKMKPAIAEAGSSSAEADGLFEAYAHLARALRAWLIGYGIGVPVLMASQDAFAKILANRDLSGTMIILFLGGTCTQIFTAMMYKAVMWYKYFGELDETQDAEGKFKMTKRYIVSDWISNQFWLEIMLDLLTVCLYIVATGKALFAFSVVA